MKQIPLTRGKVALVDDWNYGFLSRFKWHFTGKYAAHMMYEGSEEQRNFKLMFMHRLLLLVPDGIQVDHINGNKLDNREENLRRADMKQNSQNRRPKRHHSSVFKGVSFHKRSRKWVAFIGTGARNGAKYLGSFNEEKSAAVAYDEAARERYQDFAWLNFPNER